MQDDPGRRLADDHRRLAKGASDERARRRLVRRAARRQWRSSALLALSAAAGLAVVVLLARPHWDQVSALLDQPGLAGTLAALVVYGLPMALIALVAVFLSQRD